MLFFCSSSKTLNISVCCRHLQLWKGASVLPLAGLGSAACSPLSGSCDALVSIPVSGSAHVYTGCSSFPSYTTAPLAFLKYNLISGLEAFHATFQPAPPDVEEL